MAFVDQDRRREKASSGAIAVALVSVVGYALVSGLSVRIIPTIPWNIPTQSWRHPLPPPPPPSPHPQPRKTSSSTSDAHPLPQQQPVNIHPIDPGTIDLGPGPEIFPDSGLPTIDAGTPSQPLADLSARATPNGDPGGWVTTDDYPPAAARAGQQGRTGFRLDIGSDGHATACTVVSSSGSDELDRTACRLLQRKARFTPAKDIAGRATASHYSGTVVWTLPRD
jgi:protein TonB